MKSCILYSMLRKGNKKILSIIGYIDKYTYVVCDENGLK